MSIWKFMNSDKWADRHMDAVVSLVAFVISLKGLWKGGVDNHQGKPVLKCL